MQKFYFTYGTDCDHPFKGGWTEVEAEDLTQAIRLFQVVHQDTPHKCLNCAFVYDEESFKKTSMYTRGNFGAFCHESIVLSRDDKNQFRSKDHEDDLSDL